MKKLSLKDALLSIWSRLGAGAECIRSDVCQYLASFPEDRSAFFSTSVPKKSFISTYYPFSAKLNLHIGELDEAARALGTVLEKSEQQMDVEVLTRGGQILEQYWCFKGEINAFLQGIDAILRRHSDALPLPELRVCTLRLSYQAKNFSDYFSNK